MRNQKTVTRQMDELGRIVIPADIREAFEWGIGTRLEVAISDSTAKSIIIKEVFPCCSLCRKKSDCLMRIEKGYMCQGCLEKINYYES